MIEHNKDPKIHSILHLVILGLLCKQQLCGYQIQKLIEQSFNKKPSQGTVYPFLHKMLKHGLIEETQGNVEFQREKKQYKISSKGKIYFTNLISKIFDLLGETFDLSENE